LIFAYFISLFLSFYVVFSAYLFTTDQNNYIQSSFHKFAGLWLIHRTLHLWILLLQLKQQWWIFDFDQIVHVFEACFHECHLRLYRVISKSNRLTHSILRTCHKIARKQFNELIFDVLYEVQLCSSVPIHDENGEEGMWLFNAGVNHFDENIGIITEFNHELLVFLHHSKTILIHNMRIVKEQIILRSQFNFDILKVVGIALKVEWNIWVSYCCEMGSIKLIEKIIPR